MFNFIKNKNDFETFILLKYGLRTCKIYFRGRKKFGSSACTCMLITSTTIDRCMKSEE